MVGFVRAGVGCGRRVEASGLPGFDVGLVSGLLASLGEVLRCPSRREGPVRIDVLCAALDSRPRPHQAQQADAAHNPALLIGRLMCSCT